jgi:hypothetical protein
MDDKTFMNPEKAAVALLRIFAEKNGVTLPKRLDDFTKFNAKQTHKPGGLPDAEALR